MKIGVCILAVALFEPSVAFRTKQASTAAFDQAVRSNSPSTVPADSPQDFEWFWTIGERLPDFVMTTYLNGEKQEEKREPRYDYKEVLDQRSRWPERLKNCLVTAGTTKIRQLTRFIDGGAQGRVFSLGRDEFAVKFFKNVEDATRELDVLKLLSQGEAGKSKYLMHLAPDATQGSCCGVPCVVTEYVKGDTLASLLKKSGWSRDEAPEHPLEEQFAKSAACQALRGFRDMEEAGIANCDQNLRNIMVGKDGSLKFIDFGLANHSTSWHKHCYWGGITSSSPQSLIDIAYALSLEARTGFLDFAARAQKYTTAREALDQELAAGEEAPNYFAEKDCNPVSPLPPTTTTTVPSLSAPSHLHLFVTMLVMLFPLTGA